MALSLDIVHRIAIHGGGKIGVCKDGGLGRSEPGHGADLCGHGPDRICLEFLVDLAVSSRFFATAGSCFPTGLTSGAAEGVGLRTAV